MSIRQLVCSLLLLFLFGLPRIAHAQPGAVANAAVGVMAADGSNDVSISGGIGYRFNRAIGFGIEFTHVPRFGSQGLYAFSALRVCCGIGDGDFDGHATVFTTNVRVEIPTTMRRVIPFVIGGGGIASVTEGLPIYYAVPLADQAAALGLSIPSPNILPGPQNYSVTTLAMALTLGGGASFLVTDHVAVDADLRVLKLLADTDRNIGRFQIGVSYRF